MIRIVLFLALSGSAVASSSGHRIPHTAAENLCAATMVSAFPADAVREEIATAATRDRERPRKEAKISPLRGAEAPLVPVLVSPRPTQVLYLGSGGDIFRVLRDFPAADEIHLVDVLSGWGKCPASVLIEVAARLKALPGAEVRSSQRGFTANMTAEELCSRDDFYNKLASDPWRLTPFVWEMSWQSRSAQTLHRRVHLHVVNYHDADEFPALVERIAGRGPIVGTMVTGAWEPEDPSQEAVLRRLVPSGAYVFETFGEHFGSAPPGPSARQHELFRNLGFTWVEVPGGEKERPRLRASRTFVAIRR